MEARSSKYKERIIYDVLYGFIYLTEVEYEIIHSPFYQRLRWIKQLGFSSYVFPGAEHSRFGHSIGVMYNAHCILKSIGKAVNDEKLFNVETSDLDVNFHQSLRLAALMHDLGTFPFSHTTEMAYIKYGETNNKNHRGLKDDHENLGSFIIKNTDYEGGITHILKKYEIDPQRISDLVKGVDKSILANQILHSEIDCDRMDYLLRDAHYTGLKYGSYDRTYLLHHFQLENIGGHNILTINKNAIHCIEDFLMSRFAWYSQVIRSTRGAKYDALAEELCHFMLKKNKIMKYSELLDAIVNNPNEFYRFNDGYFMGTLLQLYNHGELDKEPAMKDMAECILFEKDCHALRSKDLGQNLLSHDDASQNEKLMRKPQELLEKINGYMKKNGGKQHWVVPDLPGKNNIIFIKSKNRIVKELEGENVLLTRDPVKINYGNGQIKLLADVDNSLIYRLQNTFNYIPNIYCSHETYELLKSGGVVD